jgi:hypothetical protein
MSCGPNVKIASYGGTFISDTTTTNGDYQAIQVVTAAKFHTLTGNVAGLANTTEGSAIAVPANAIINGTFSAIKLHSGSVIAYVK